MEICFEDVIKKKENCLQYYHWLSVIPIIIESEPQISNSILLFFEQFSLLNILCKISNKAKKEIMTAVLLYLNQTTFCFSKNTLQGVDNLLILLKVDSKTKKILKK